MAGFVTGFGAPGAHVVSARVCARSVRMSAEDDKVEVKLPQKHATAMLTTVGAALLTYGVTRSGFEGRFNPYAFIPGAASGWLAITALPFLLDPNRTVKIDELKSRSALNTDLIAPDGFTQCVPPPSKPSETYDCTASELRDKFLIMLSKQNDVTLLSADEENLLYGFVQVTPIVRYPDVISVQFISSGEGKSTLAIYSTSIFGAGDLGKNANRLKEWLSALDLEVSS